MSRTSDCFDEYGNYGENNPPVPPAVENDRKDIRPMTEEERQRAKEREDANKIMAMIEVERVREFESGAAEYNFTLNDEAQEIVLELGLSFVMHCAAVKMDTQDALDIILEQGCSDE